MAKKILLNNKVYKMKLHLKKYSDENWMGIIEQGNNSNMHICKDGKYI